MRAPSPLAAPLETRFGSFDVQRHDVISFADGLPGFESCRCFVLLSSDAFAPLQCLHAVDGEPAVDGELPSFLAIDPSLVVPAYRSAFDLADYPRLGAVNDDQLVWLALISLEGEGGGPTANLRAPVVINPALMVGAQLVSTDRSHSVRHPLAA